MGSGVVEGVKLQIRSLGGWEVLKGILQFVVRLFECKSGVFGVMNTIVGFFAVECALKLPEGKLKIGLKSDRIFKTLHIF